jgi:hypothetical protein
LAELTPSLPVTVFDTLPIWQSGANFLKLMVNCYFSALFFSLFSHCFPLFSSIPLFFLPIFFPVPISTLKQDNTTLMLSNGLCGFKVKNARRKKTQWRKKKGLWQKKGGVAEKVEKSSKKVKNRGQKKKS